jgi:hypothetical protein
VPRLGRCTQAGNGKGDAHRYCKDCHPGAIRRPWTRERVLEAMLEWQRRYGWLPSAHDWSRTHASRRGGEAVKRSDAGKWPSASVVGKLFGGWAVAREEATRVLAGRVKLGERDSPDEAIRRQRDT